MDELELLYNVGGIISLFFGVALLRLPLSLVARVSFLHHSRQQNKNQFLIRRVVRIKK